MARTLTLSLALAAALHAGAQCVPNALYADSVYGVWPDTTENFAPGMVGVFYSDTLNILVPSNASLIDPDYPSFVSIDSISLNQVTGLPPGIQVSCNSQTAAPCTYLANQLGCGLLEGTPTQVGTFNIVLEVTAYANFLGPQAIPQSFSGYSITILPSTVGIGEIKLEGPGTVRNVPNPFAARTDIEFDLGKAAPVNIQVFSLVGELVWQQTVQGKAGNNHVPFRANELENGVYLYHIEAAGLTRTGRMMVNH